MNPLVPLINNECVIIVDREHRELAAVISSYLHRKGKYLPMFEFPFVAISKPPQPPQGVDDDSLFIIRAIDFDVCTHNVLHKLKECERVILAGLSIEQKSYLSYLGNYQVIEIASVDQVHEALAEFIPDRNETIYCKSEQLLQGLYNALCTGRRLSMSQDAQDIEVPPESKEGLIIIEDLTAVSSVVAVTYSCSVDASIKIVSKTEKGDERKIRLLIEKWRKTKSLAAYAELMDIIRPRLEGIWFAQYVYVTFFTSGIPYSLYMHNCIPCSYVHLLYRPDFFIFNNLFFENYSPLTSAIVFSIPEFVKHDETDIVSKTLLANNYYVRALVGKNAKAYNLDLHIRDFAYGLLHISSHGGEITGTTIVREFKTEDGATHRYEYDEIATFAPQPGNNQVAVTIKWFPRTLDGYVYGSKELEEQNYPDYVFDAIARLYNTEDKKNIISIERKSTIPDSCSISCSDFEYQAGFDRLATGRYSPIVFNNSCWSWSAISHEFLYTGVRGYIGTLFAIGTSEATAATIDFYNYVFVEPFIDAVFKANNIVRKSDYEDVYIFYGLHLATLKSGSSVTESRIQVARNGMRSFYTWMDRKGTAADKLTNQRIDQLVEWNVDQLRDLKPECEHIIAEGKRKMEEQKKDA